MDRIVKERACIILSKYFELLGACLPSQGLHRYGSAYMEQRISSIRKKERIFCNKTVPEDNWYWMDVEKHMRLHDGVLGNGEETEKDNGPPSTWPGRSAGLETRTDVSIYYTESLSM